MLGTILGLLFLAGLLYFSVQAFGQVLVAANGARVSRLGSALVGPIVTSRRGFEDKPLTKSESAIWAKIEANWAEEVA